MAVLGRLERKLLLMAMPIDGPQSGFGIAEGGEVVLEAAALVLYFLRRSDAELPEDGYWRAPALEGVLEEKALDDKWQQEPAAVFRKAESQAEQRERRGERFDPALDIPFFIELAKTALDCRPAASRDLAHSFFRLAGNAAIDFRARVTADAMSGVGEHGEALPLRRRERLQAACRRSSGQ
jgi:hypothetical protein